MALLMQILVWLSAACGLIFTIVFMAGTRRARYTRILFGTLAVGLTTATAFLIGTRVTDGYADCSALAWFTGSAAAVVCLMLRFMPEVFATPKRR